MSYAIIRNANHKISAVPLLERHNERLNHNYSNPDISSKENYHLKAPPFSYLQTFDEVRKSCNLKGNLRLQGKKQSTILCEFIITSDKDFFERIGEERTKQFFRDAYNFVEMKVGGDRYIVSAVVHMDENTPHMHISYIPVVNGKDRKGNPCKRINCSEFWKGKDSYSKLQDEYFDWITSHGYDLERGNKGSTSEHLSVAEYKLKKTNEQIAAAKEQAKGIENIEGIKSKNLPLNMVTLKRSDFDDLTSAAKGYVISKLAEKENIKLKAEVADLRNKNESLKNERDMLSGKLKEMEHSYGEFYDSVSDEIALKNENLRLSEQIHRLGNQYHGVVAELKSQQEKNEILENTVEEQKQEIDVLNEKLTALQSLHKIVSDKLQKVMKFIESMKLKDKLEAFLNQKNKKHTL